MQIEELENQGENDVQSWRWMNEMFIEGLGFIGGFGLGVHNMIEDFVCYW